MPFASTSAAASLRARSVPFFTVTALSLTLYATHARLKPIRMEDLLPVPDSLSSPAKKAKPVIIPSGDPYVPLGWGSNRFLTLSSDDSVGQVKKPTPLAQLGSTPLRDLVLAERYGVANVRSVAPAASKLFALSKDGRLYAVSASKRGQSARLDKNERSWWAYLFGSDSGVDFFELQAAGGFKRGERWAGVSTGTHHLLAVTTKGRVFSLPISPSANRHRQLGTRETFETQLPSTGSPASTSPMSTASSPARLSPDADPRFARTLTEIPSLIGISISQVAASDRSSFVRTPTGRVLGFGANEAGQIGLGANAAVETIQTPVEVVLARNYPGGTTLRCLDIKAGGTTTMFIVERDTPGKPGTWVDLLACGNGMSGALGNGLWTSASGAPVRVKTVSGLQEFSEKDNAFIPLRIHDVSISPSPAAHVYAVLDTVREAEEQGVKKGLYGRDVMVWGGNADYQLGNGKRSSLAVPQHLPPLISREYGAASSETSWGSGTLSPMPHHRLQLHETKANAYDLNGKLIKRGVKCEEVVAAGYNASVLYNKIID